MKLLNRSRVFFGLLFLQLVFCSNVTAHYVATKTQVADSDTSDKKAATAVVSSDVVIQKVDGNFADFPRGMTSFGAAAIDGRVFVSRW